MPFPTKVEIHLWRENVLRPALRSGSRSRGWRCRCFIDLGRPATEPPGQRAQHPLDLFEYFHR
ncbi:hypothetical protein BV133_688 [Blastochloris viridis]|uniref:Uncharacterized protein n=1 Tax=Blastochloris viridis TaxID=1079 RepID=A0A182D064_BLAVI|nr:hypothetical protein BV133_688 [Blastochloris viridis]